MPIPAIVILSAVGVLFVAGIVWLLATGSTPKIPPGDEQTVESDGIKVHVRWCYDTFAKPPTDEPRLVTSGLANGCHAGVLCAAESWTAAANGADVVPFTVKVDAKHALREVRVVFMSARLFDQIDGSAAITDGANAIQTSTPQRIGSGCPVFYIRESFVGVAHGSLCVHESLHVLASAASLSVEDNHKHGETRLWAKSSKDGSIEGNAYQRWLALMGNGG